MVVCSIAMVDGARLVIFSDWFVFFFKQIQNTQTQKNEKKKIFFLFVETKTYFFMIDGGGDG
jgi:hypothetical protein